MNKKLKMASLAVVAVASVSVSSIASANLCNDVSFADFTTAVDTAYAETNQFGFGLPMWATLVNTGGKVCYVYSVKGSSGSVTPNGGATSGNNAWLGSRIISAQKANTANAFSLDDLAISSGAVYAAVLPGGSLYGLQHSNPVDTDVAYSGAFRFYGTEADALVGTRIGGVNVFGGGVALYNGAGIKVGAIGVSGDTSCRDHTMAYRLRVGLGLDNQPNDDGLKLIDTSVTPVAALFQQPACGVSDPTPNTSNTNDSAADDFGIRG